DHPGGDRGLKAERITDRDHELAALEPLGIAEACSWQGVRAVDAHKREVGVGIVANHASRQTAPIDSCDIDAVCASNYVAVGEYQPVRGHDYARARSATLALSVASLDVEADHRRADSIDHVDHGPGIGIQESLVIGWNRVRLGNISPVKHRFVP